MVADLFHTTAKELEWLMDEATYLMLSDLQEIDTDEERIPIKPGDLTKQVSVLDYKTRLTADGIPLPYEGHDIPVFENTFTVVLDIKYRRRDTQGSSWFRDSQEYTRAWNVSFHAHKILEEYFAHWGSAMAELTGLTPIEGKTNRKAGLMDEHQCHYTAAGTGNPDSAQRILAFTFHSNDIFQVRNRVRDALESYHMEAKIRKAETDMSFRIT